MRQSVEEGLNSSSTGRQQYVNLLFINCRLQDTNYMVPAVVLLVLFILFLSVSIFLFVEVSWVTEVSNTYYQPSGNNCLPGSTCNITMYLPQTMEPPIRVMFRLGNYYQETIRYVQSKSNSQLAGNLPSGEIDDYCAPVLTNNDMEADKSWNGTALNANQIASPCGAISKNFFNDTYKLYKGTEQIPIDENDIAFSGDKERRYKRSERSPMQQWLDPQDQHVMVWMRMAGLPNFKILWGKIHEKLTAGSYYLVINNNYPVEDRDGSRQFILTTWSAAGGKNYLLPIAFLVVAVFALACSLFFWRRYFLQKEVK